MILEKIIMVEMVLQKNFLQSTILKKADEII